eukprot:COSAG05_NODE_3284_length_2177_cov_2.952358_2_plen_475_part_00
MKAVAPLALLALLLPRRTSAHGMLSVPTPRTGTAMAGGNKNSGTPCGSATNTKGAATATLAAGAATTVKWTFGANHGGPCTIKLASGTQGGAGEPDFSTAADLGGGEFACGDETKTVTVPANTPAGAGVLQWHWQGDGAYDDCADVTISAAGPPPGPPPPAPDFADVEVIFSNDPVSVTESWRNSIKAEISTHVGIDVARIEIAEESAASLRILFRFWDAPDESGVGADQAADELSEQLSCNPEEDDCEGIMAELEFSCCYQSHQVVAGGGYNSPAKIGAIVVLLIVALLLGAAAFVYWMKGNELTIRGKTYTLPALGGGFNKGQPRPSPQASDGEAFEVENQLATHGDTSALGRVKGMASKLRGKVPPPSLPQRPRQPLRPPPSLEELSEMGGGAASPPPPVIRPPPRPGGSAAVSIDAAADAAVATPAVDGGAEQVLPPLPVERPGGGALALPPRMPVGEERVLPPRVPPPP